MLTATSTRRLSPLVRTGTGGGVLTITLVSLTLPSTICAGASPKVTRSGSVKPLPRIFTASPPWPEPTSGCTRET